MPRYCAESDPKRDDIIDKEFGAFPLEKSQLPPTDNQPAVDLYGDLFGEDGKQEGVTWLRARVSAVGLFLGYLCNCVFII